MKIHLPAFGPDLPVHPFTGLRALGLRRNGAPIWPVKGGAPDDDTDDGDTPDDDAEGDNDSGDGDTSDDDGDSDLRDAGKKAIDRMKGQLKKSRSDLRSWTALAQEHGARTPDELRNLIKGKKPDGGDVSDPEQIRRETRAEVEKETARDRLLDKIEARAGGKFADPADAAALLLRENDLDDFLDGTKVDAEAITEALDELLKRKPYLAGKPTTDSQRRPKPDKSQGNRSGEKLSAGERAAKRLERLGISKPA